MFHFKLEILSLCICYRSYIAIIKELSGNERSELTTLYFMIVIYDL